MKREETDVSTKDYVSHLKGKVGSRGSSLETNVDVLQSETDASETSENRNSYRIVKTELLTDKTSFGENGNKEGNMDEVSITDDSNSESRSNKELLAGPSTSKGSQVMKMDSEKEYSLCVKEQEMSNPEKKSSFKVKLKDKPPRKSIKRKNRRLLTKNSNDDEIDPKSKKLKNVSYDDVENRSKLKLHCDDCQKTFIGRRRYENHLIDGKCHFECEFCGKIFHHRNKSSYEVHLKQHRNELDFHCEECGMSFVTKFNLVRHQQARHATDRPHQCEICTYRFHTKQALLRHIEKTHYEGNYNHSCPMCSRTYTLPSVLQLHIQKAHLDPDIPCSVCGKLVRPQSIRRHESTHNDFKNFKCDYCSATFKTKGELMAHKKRHNKDYSDYCETCGKGFYGSTPLRIHRRVHTGEKPYACSQCDYRSALKGNLKLHMKVHEKL